MDAEDHLTNRWQVGNIDTNIAYRFDPVGNLTNIIYDAAWNLNYRTNNALVQSFGVDSLNQLTTLTRSGTMTVAGSVSTEPTSVTVKDNNNAAQAATVYGDNTFARANVTLLNGTNTFAAVAQDSYGRVDTNTVTTWLPATGTCYYDGRGNLTNDGRRVFYYDAENQLVTVLVSNAWRSDFVYDGLMRRRVRKEFAWSGGAWTQTNEVRYVYDGRLVVQERHYTPNGSSLIPLTAVTYTRGNDLSGSLQGAGGIGGLLARSDSLSAAASGGGGSTAFYHADGNGNITALIGTNGIVVARYNYDPYGNILAMNGPLAEANLYRFSSKEFHPNSGLVYYLYRYYEPTLQRWINKDPQEERGCFNMYAFLQNTPAFFIDAFGLGDNALLDLSAGWPPPLPEPPTWPPIPPKVFYDRSPLNWPYKTEPDYLGKDPLGKCLDACGDAATDLPGVGEMVGDIKDNIKGFASENPVLTGAAAAAGLAAKLAMGDKVQHNFNWNLDKDLKLSIKPWIQNNDAGFSFGCKLALSLSF